MILEKHCWHVARRVASRFLFLKQIRKLYLNSYLLVRISQRGCSDTHVTSLLL